MITALLLSLALAVSDTCPEWTPKPGDTTYTEDIFMSQDGVVIFTHQKYGCEYLVILDTESREMHIFPGRRITE